MKNLKVKVYLLLSKTNKHKEAPIYIRVLLGGQSFNLSSGIFINPDFWDRGNKIVRSKHPEAVRLNNLLNESIYRLQDIHYDLLKEGACNLPNLRDRFLRKEAKNATLFELLDHCTTKVEEGIGKTYAKGTWVHYKSLKKILQDFLKVKFDKKDFDLNQLSLAFITKLEHYLYTIRNNNSNTVSTTMCRVKKIIHDGIAQEWIKVDPFKNYKIVKADANRDHLTIEELSRLDNLTDLEDFEERVRDVFIFSCYTGLSYGDLKALRPSDILQSIDGSKIIRIHRKKTFEVCNIPLLPRAADLLEKYKEHPICLNRNTCLPVITNRRMNDRLKDLADDAKIDKHLTCHIGRHTFATMSLEMGVPMETVSKVLGHKNIKTTQIYGKITNSKIANDYKQFYTPKTNNNGTSDERRSSNVEG